MITLRHRAAKNLHNTPEWPANFCKLCDSMDVQATFCPFSKYANFAQLIS